MQNFIDHQAVSESNKCPVCGVNINKNHQDGCEHKVCIQCGEKWPCEGWIKLELRGKHIPVRWQGSPIITLSNVLYDFLKAQKEFNEEIQKVNQNIICLVKILQIEDKIKFFNTSIENAGLGFRELYAKLDKDLEGIKKDMK